MSPLTTAGPRLALRPYQIEAIDAVREASARGVRRPAVVLPTGLGKTVIFAHLLADLALEGRRGLVLVHRDELVKQAVSKVQAIEPSLHVGVVKAERDEVDAQIVVASVQTLASTRRLDRLVAESITLGGFDLVVVDEAHHAAADTYRRVIDALDAPTTLGFTATMSRNDSRALGEVWQEVVYTRDTLYGIRGGHLVDVVGLRVTVDELDLATVAKRRGDYADGSLGNALVESGAGKAIADAYLQHAPGRRAVLFAPTVDSAHALAADLDDAGVPTEVVTGGTPTDERTAIYERFRTGETMVLANCMVLTEGWDAPWAEVAIIARPTTSSALYVQMVGRVLRPHPGKGRALVLDVVGVSASLKLAGLVDLVGPGGREPKPGESLLDAADRPAEEHVQPIERGAYEGLLRADAVDLFATSTSAWLATDRGVMFIPTREALFFVTPDPDEPGTFRAGRSGSSYAMKGGKWLTEPCSLSLAMSWAEEYAKMCDPSVASRDASWRKGKRAPSDAQLGLAQRLGIHGADGMTKNELSDAISVHYANRVLKGVTP